MSEVRLTRRLAAEFGVIVLGVIVALGADRWIQSRDERGLEADYLARLEAELVQDSASLDQEWRSSQAAAGVTRQLLLWVDGEPVSDTVDASTWVRTLVVASWYGAFDPGRTTWNELIATGNLHVLSHRGVREALGDWQDVAERVDAWEEDWAPPIEEFMRELRISLPPLVHIQALRSLELGDVVGAFTPMPLMEGVDLPRATPADLRRVVDYFRNDDEAAAALSQTHVVHWARANVYGPGAFIRIALDGTLDDVRAAREAVR